MGAEDMNECEVCHELFSELFDNICTECKAVIYEEINLFGERLS